MVVRPADDLRQESFVGFGSVPSRPGEGSSVGRLSPNSCVNKM